MKQSMLKRITSALLVSCMLIACAPTVLAEDSVAPQNEEQTNAVTDTEAKSEERSEGLIEYANGLANGTHTYYSDNTRHDVIIQNQGMSLNYGLVAGENDMYVKELSNTKGVAYIENTFDVFVANTAGEKFYASQSIIGAAPNIYRYGYYYYENRIEGQCFATDIVAQNGTYEIGMGSNANKKLTDVANKNQISTPTSNGNGGIYFIANNNADDVNIGYKFTNFIGTGGLDTTKYDYVEIKFKAESVSSTGQVFVAAGDKTDYTQEQSVSFSVVNDGEYHVYRIALANIAGYTGKLKKLRFDINAQGGTRVDIEYIRLYKSEYVGIDPQLTMQRSFLTYSDKLHHLTQFSTTGEVTDVSAVGMETKIEASRVNALVVKDKNGLKYDLASVDWASAEYAGFDIEGAGIFGYILPADNNSGSMTIELVDGYYVITQILPVDKFTPSDKDSLNGNDIFFGQRIYNDENHDFGAFIAEAECERHPLTEENIIVDFSEDGFSSFAGYDALRGHYKFLIGGTGFNPAYYLEQNRHYNVRFTVKGDDKNRQMYFMTHNTGGGCIECAVLLDDKDMVLPIPIEVAKNFPGDGENTIYNIDDSGYSETYFPMVVNAGETFTYNIVNLYQNWGKFPLKQISSIQFHTPYYHLSTGVTETNCITLFSVNAPSLPDHRTMSAPFWRTQPQHNSGGIHSFLNYTDAAGNSVSSQNSSAVIDSHGPTYSEIVYGVESSDGKISATYTHIEFPQTDENRTYYEMKYTFNEDVSFTDFAHNFVFYSVTDNHNTASYEKVGYLDKYNVCQVVDSVTNSTAKEYILGDECPYFSFFMMPDWDRNAEWIEGYTNLSMLFKDWKVICNGEEMETQLLLINKNSSLTLSMNIADITFKKGDSITINAIIMPWGSQEMENNASNRLNAAHVAEYSSPTYNTELPDGTLYMDKNVRDVRENTLLNPLTATAVENCTVLDSPFVPRVKTTNGKSATFTITGGYNNNAVRVYGFDKLTAPKIEQLVDGEWVEYEVSSKSTPDTSGYSHDYDGYMAHYDEDGTYSYSFVFDMTDVESRTFRVSAEEDFEGWEYNPDEAMDSPMNVYIDAATIQSSAYDDHFTSKELSSDGSYVTLTFAADQQETYINLYSGGENYPTGQYIVYKYRIPTTNSTEIREVQFWTSTTRTGAGGNDYLSVANGAMIRDGEWHVMVVDVVKLKQEGCDFAPNENGFYSARYLRIDPSNNLMNAGDSIDIAYVGISDSISEIIEANQDVASIDIVNANKASYTSMNTAGYAAAGATKLTLESTSIRKNEELVLALKVENNSGMNFVRLIPRFDTEIFTLKEIVNGNMISHISPLNGSFIWNEDVISTGDGDLAYFVFEIKEDAPFGKYEIAIDLVDAFGQSADFSAVAVGSVVNIIEHICGDCTGDDKINTFDVIALRDYLANYDYENDVPGVSIGGGADANGDGYINSADLTAIRQYLAYYDYNTGTSSKPLGRE